MNSKLKIIQVIDAYINEMMDDEIQQRNYKICKIIKDKLAELESLIGSDLEDE